MTTIFALCILPGLTCGIREPSGGHWGSGRQDPVGGGRRGRGMGRGEEHGVMMDRYRKQLAERINIRRRIDKDNVQTTEDISPGSGRSKRGI